LEKNAETTPKGAEPRLRLDGLFEFVLGDTREYQAQQRDLRIRYGKNFQEAMEWIYKAGSSPGAWPPANMGVGSDGSRLAINAGVAKFDEYWRSRLERPNNSALAGVEELRKSLEEFEAARDQLRQTAAVSA